MPGWILGIETSCDETSAAVLRAEGGVGSVAGHVILSQDVHRVFGGVVPELASRAHVRTIGSVVDQALADAGIGLAQLDGIVVTAGPGLVGALLVGVTYGKTLAFSLDRPLLGVNHLEGHLFAPSLEDPELAPPFVALLVSGGHTMLLDVPAWGEYRLLGQTLDDAAGEAFDKGARLLGLGYPGGPAIDRAAREGDPTAFGFPRSAPGELDFSFSGLKTALLYTIRDLGDAEAERRRADLAASYQRAIVEALVSRTKAALDRDGVARLAVGGGVAANSELRTAVEDLGVPVWVPPLELCTDNAAMIGGAARFLEPLPYPEYLALDAAARVA